MTRPVPLEGQTRRELYETALDQGDTISLYREQIAFLKAELERASLLVAIHHTPAERIHALKTEWRVTRDPDDTIGPVYETFTDALETKHRWDESQPGIPHQIVYRHRTPWRTAQ